MTYVRKANGDKLLCTWDDCEKYGHEEHKVVVREPSKNMHYIFCNETHMQFFINSHNDNGNLATGEKSKLWLPPKTTNRAMRRAARFN